MTANGDGSNVQTLVDDGVSKSDPHWSPTGDRIVYWTPGPDAKDPTSPVNLVVITADGKPVTTIAVSKKESEPWVFFRGVELGWNGNDAVFARGFVNTVVGDYRVVDIRSGQESHNYWGDQFGTCEVQAKVAVGTLIDMSGKKFVEVNGSPVYPIPSRAGIGFGIHWFADCSRMAFIESTVEGMNVSATLVVLSGTSVEAKIPIPAWMCVFVPVGSSFMIGGSRTLVNHEYNGALLYDTTTHKLRPDPDILGQLQERAAREEQVMRTLGGQCADWYRSSQSQQTDIWQNVKAEARRLDLKSLNLSPAQLVAIRNALKARERLDVETCVEEEPDWVEKVFIQELPVSEAEKVLLVEAGPGCARGGQGSNGAMWVVRVEGERLSFLATPAQNFEGFLYSIQPTRSHGFQDLVLGWHMSAVETGLGYLSFDGTSYRLVGGAIRSVSEDGTAKIVPDR